MFLFTVYQNQMKRKMEESGGIIKEERKKMKMAEESKEKETKEESKEKESKEESKEKD